MNFLKVLGVVLLLIIGWNVAKEFRHIAEEKGFGDTDKYFWYTFFLGFIGMFMVAALPDRAVKAKIQAPSLSTNTKTSSDELPEL